MFDFIMNRGNGINNNE